MSTERLTAGVVGPRNRTGEGIRQRVTSAVVGGSAGAVRHATDASGPKRARGRPVRPRTQASQRTSPRGGWSHRASPSHICNVRQQLSFVFFKLNIHRRGCEHQQQYLGRSGIK